MTVALTDREVAVLIDSLAWMRDGLKREGMDAPNVESALDKIKSLMAPDTIGLLIKAIKAKPTKPTIGLMARDHDVMQGTFTDLEEARKALRALGSNGWTLVNIIEGHPEEGYIIEMYKP